MAWRAVQAELRERLAYSSVALQALSIILFIYINFIYTISFKGGLVELEGTPTHIILSGYGIAPRQIAQEFSNLILYITITEIGLLILQITADKTRASRFLGISLHLVSFNLMAMGLAALKRLQLILYSYSTKYTNIILEDGTKITGSPIVHPVPNWLLAIIILIALTAFILRGYDWILSELNAELEELEWESLVYSLLIISIIFFAAFTRILIPLPPPAKPNTLVHTVAESYYIDSRTSWINITELQACMDWKEPPNITRGAVYIIVPPHQIIENEIIYGKKANYKLWIKGYGEYYTGVKAFLTYKTMLVTRTSKPTFTTSFYDNKTILVTSTNYPAWGVKKLVLLVYIGNKPPIHMTIEDINRWPYLLKLPEDTKQVIIRIYFLYHGKEIMLQANLYPGKTVKLRSP